MHTVVVYGGDVVAVGAGLPEVGDRHDHQAGESVRSSERIAPARGHRAGARAVDPEIGAREPLLEGGETTRGVEVALDASLVGVAYREAETPSARGR